MLDVFTDLKRHDLGPNFWERNFDDGDLQKEFVTEPLWGVGSTAPYGHDGRSINLREVILRHGGEALDPVDPGWYAFLQEAAEHAQQPVFSEYAIEMGRDTLENWQSEFLQLLWQVVGLAYFLRRLTCLEGK